MPGCVSVPSSNYTTEACKTASIPLHVLRKEGCIAACPKAALDCPGILPPCPVPAPDHLNTITRVISAPPSLHGLDPPFPPATRELGERKQPPAAQTRLGGGMAASWMQRAATGGTTAVAAAAARLQCCGPTPALCERLCPSVCALCPMQLCPLCVELKNSHSRHGFAARGRRSCGCHSSAGRARPGSPAVHLPLLACCICRRCAVEDPTGAAVWHHSCRGCAWGWRSRGGRRSSSSAGSVPPLC